MGEILGAVSRIQSSNRHRTLTLSLLLLAITMHVEFRIYRALLSGKGVGRIEYSIPKAIDILGRLQTRYENFHFYGFKGCC